MHQAKAEAGSSSVIGPDEIRLGGRAPTNPLSGAADEVFLTGKVDL